MSEKQQLLPLRPLQIQDVAFHMRNVRGGNLSDPATGKTAPTNVYMWYLWSEHKVKSIFLMPTSLFRQNYKSFFRFTHFEPDQIVILRGTPAQKAKQMANPRGVVFIASFNFFAPKPGRKEVINAFGDVIKAGKPEGPSMYQQLRQHHNPEAIAVDEWHMGFKSIESKRTQGFIGNLYRSIPIFIPMTGTAVDGHLDSVYPLIHCIDPLYYVNHKDFLNQHAVYDFFGGKITGWRNVEKVREILNKHCIRHTFEEVYGKDATVVEPIECEMSEGHKDFYDEYESTGLMETAEGFREAAHGGEMVLRLRQICNCPEHFWNEWGVVGADKFDLTKDEHLEITVVNAINTNKNLLIFAAFIPEQERIYEICKKHTAKVKVLNGTVPQGKQREKIEEDFRERKLDIVVASPEIVAVGYDWPDLDICYFYSLDYKDTNFLQGYRRGVRGQRKVPLLCYVPYYVGTVEEDVIGIVEGKMNLAQQTDPTRLVFDLIKRRHSSLQLGTGRTGQVKGKKLKIGEMKNYK